ncbi:MAG: hypothetical protein FJ086_04160 [Deltaproteobacteria bacterium]|nr:hypothetical protein [Deltaproteobacteria bacterium]
MRVELLVLEPAWDLPVHAATGWGGRRAPPWRWREQACCGGTVARRRL